MAIIKNKKNILKIIILILFSISLCIFFSYRLLDVPMGLTSDETALGYNAVLLSRTGHDENGRFMPIFVLSNDGKDWKQPITQYYLALLFFIFKPSLFLLRFSSVLITLVSSLLIYKFSKEIFNSKYAIIATIIFLTTPLILIQSHLGLDNIMPLPFTILWIYGLYLFEKNKNIKFLIISALALGISFYTYKGMRAIFPIWYLLSLIYIFKKPLIKNIRPILVFSTYSLPFLLISPFLDQRYAGAIFGGANPKIDNIYNFIYPYLSSFDPTFLFITGDDLLFHSTGHHGFFLLASLPLFLAGIFKSIRHSKFSRFALLIFFTTPLLYGMVGSIHRASRLMCLIPFYSIICIYGFQQLMNIGKKYKVVIALFLLTTFTVNYYDFARYYYFDYAKITQSFVGDLKYYLSFKELKDYSEKLKLKPYVAQNISNIFFESIYFKDNPTYINQDLSCPSGSILLTNRGSIEGMTNLNVDMKYYQLQIKN